MRLRPFSLGLAVALLAGAGAGAAPASAAPDPLRSIQWALDAIHLGPPAPAPEATAGGPLVAVVDSGVDMSHPDLGGRVVAGPDLVGGDSDPTDVHGHGTHIAGIIAATAGNGIGGSGVAPDARILAIRVLDENNSGTTADVAAGIDAAVAMHADVINLSLNWSAPTPGLGAVTAAMQRAVDAGIAVIVAAGNDGRGRCEEPVLARQSLCVGASASDRRLATFSSFGTDLGLLAPGDDVLSTWRGGDYRSLSGTSQAAAVTSGVAALLVGLGLHGQAVVDRLVQTARDIGPPGPDETSGHGLLDAQRAVDGAAAGRLPAILTVSAARTARMASVRRRGLRVSCDSARPGVCVVRVRSRGTVVARGSAPVDGSGPVSILAKPTAAGRRLLAPPSTRTGVVEAALAGAPGARQSLALR